MKTQLLMLAMVAAVLVQTSRGASGIEFDQACNSYVQGVDYFYFNAVNLTPMAVYYDGVKAECQEILPPNVTDVPPTIVLLDNATEVCEYVTTILFETNRTYGSGNKTYLMWVVINGETAALTKGNFGRMAETVVPYDQRTTTVPDERFTRGYGSKRRFFFVFCQNGLIDKSSFEVPERHGFQPKQFAQSHDLEIPPYSGFYHSGGYLFPNETKEEGDGRIVCNGTGALEVCVCEPLGLFIPNRGSERCFLNVDVKVQGTAPSPPAGGLMGGLMGGGVGQVVNGEMKMINGEMQMVGGAMNAAGSLLG